MKRKASAYEKTLKSKIRRKRRERSDMSALGALSIFGLVGWSIAVPALIGALLGKALDDATGERAWAAALLFLGMALGSWNAWKYIAREEAKIK